MDLEKKIEFFRLFNSIKPEMHRHEVWSDFVTTSAIALHNATYMTEALETEYMNIINTYSTDDIQRLCEMLSIVVILLEPSPTDILGALYMELGLTSENHGQYFTPDHISQCMAGVLYGNSIDTKLKQPFITLHEPSCGSGGMILAFAKIVIDKEYNPAEKLWVSAIDINRIAALMAYIQLTLWNIPAEVIVGDTLSMDFRERWLTPAHRLFNWEDRLRMRKMMDNLNAVMQANENPKSDPVIQTHGKPNTKTQKLADAQVSFDFYAK